nr:hypothetical protein CIT39_28265 [Bradyrhizobium symbiodeficiens]
MIPRRCSSRSAASTARSERGWCSSIKAFSSEVDTGSRQESASIQQTAALFRFHRDRAAARR